MASTETGQMFTQEEYDKLPEIAKTNLVELTPSESEMLAKMPRKERRQWLRTHKKAPLQRMEKEVLEDILNNSSGGGSWRRNIIIRLASLEGKDEKE